MKGRELLCLFTGVQRSVNKVQFSKAAMPPTKEENKYGDEYDEDA